MLEPMTGDVVLSEVHSLMCVVLSKAEKHLPYRHLVCITECLLNSHDSSLLGKLFWNR